MAFQPLSLKGDPLDVPDKIVPQVSFGDSQCGKSAALPDTVVAHGALLAMAGLAKDLLPVLPRGTAATRAAPRSMHRRTRRRGVAPRTDFIDIVRCRVTRRLVNELFAAARDSDLPAGVGHRRPACHRRQIAMYLSHVVLSVPYQTIAVAFGRDRTTVMHACSVVEDRRDDAGYDDFIERCGRCVEAVFAPLEHDDAAR